MEEKVKQEILRLCQEQVELDRQTVVLRLAGEMRTITSLLKGALISGFGHLPAVWGLKLYLQRN